MNVYEAIPDLRRARRANAARTWGLVPTMGFLHEGHLSLVARARAENDRVGVSIFVNPAQFNRADDLSRYPRDLDRDLGMLERAGVDLVWTPTPETVYPPGFETYIELERTTRPLEGAHRPGHFRGVATVVAKLFHVFEPDRAYFGQKDAQQVLTIQRMVEDLNFDLEVVVCSTVREPDGLALSSRNASLSAPARAQSVHLYRALRAARDAYRAGERDAEVLRRRMREEVARAPLATLEYASVAHPRTLDELARIDDGALLSLAADVGGVRLIDNVVL